MVTSAKGFIGWVIYGAMSTNKKSSGKFVLHNHLLYSQPPVLQASLSTGCWPVGGPEYCTVLKAKLGQFHVYYRNSYRLYTRYETWRPLNLNGV